MALRERVGHLLDERTYRPEDQGQGFTDAIKGVFPQTINLLCIVHQIHNSCEYVAWRDRKEFCADLKEVYAAINREVAEQAFQGFGEKWETKYRHALASWKSNWANLTNYFDYPL